MFEDFNISHYTFCDSIEKYKFTKAYYIIYIPHIDINLTHHVMKGTTSDFVYF